MIYYKRYTGKLLPQKTAEQPSWGQWTHHSEGKTHCEECLTLDRCLFTDDSHPPCPHHPYCHCTLEPIDNALVRRNAAARSDYSKFDPYLFNTTGAYPHSKEKLFAKWGYSVADAKWLQAEIEKQGLEKYISGEYTLGKLDKQGQRISIRIQVPRKGMSDPVTFLTGWMVQANGQLKLNTPYGGK